MTLIDILVAGWIFWLPFWAGGIMGVVLTRALDKLVEYNT